MVGLALAGQAGVARAATQTSTMTTTGFTCGGTACLVVTLSVGDTIDYVNATTVTLNVSIVNANVVLASASVPPNGTWSYPAATPLHDAQVSAQNTSAIPPVAITQLLTVNPLSTATSTTTTTSTATPPPTTSTHSSWAPGPSSTSAPGATTGHSSSHSDPSATASASTGGTQSSSPAVVPAGPGIPARPTGGVEVLQGGGSAAPAWWVLALLCAIAAGTAFAVWRRRAHKARLATSAAGSALLNHRLPDVPRPADKDDGPPVSYGAR